VLFPPVYIPLEVDGESYRQMHVDGDYQEIIRKINPWNAIGEMEARLEFRRLEMWRPKE